MNTVSESKKITWREIRKGSRDLLARLSQDRFLELVLRGCVRVGKDKNNQIRGNFVAAGLREAAGHVLHKLAPDDEVRACIWFVQAPDTLTVTRNQRASYIVRAGLPDEFMKGQLGIDVESCVKPLIKAMAALNKATHVRPDTILKGGAEIRQMFLNVLSGIAGLLDASDHSRETVKNAVANTMYDAVFNSLISDSIQELDELSTHTRVDGHSIELIEVEDIDAREISYRITGYVEVNLQYGSNSDIEKDIGLRCSDSYPYTASVTGNASDPMSLCADDVELSIDNSSFYE